MVGVSLPPEFNSISNAAILLAWSELVTVALRIVKSKFFAVLDKPELSPPSILLIKLSISNLV